MKHKILLSAMLMLSFLTLYSQVKPKQNQIASSSIKGIEVGQEVPDVVMQKVVQVDGSVGSAKLSDYKDRLLILDFMYTNCGSCIQGLPKKDHLQKQFGDKIKVMVVVGGETYSPGMLERENEAFIRNFLTSKNYLDFHQVKIPWVVENKELNNYFPHAFVCHMAWIYKGKLVALTEQDYVTAENIQLILDGKKNNWPVKNDFTPAYNEAIPLVKQSPALFNRFIAKNKNGIAMGAYQNGIDVKSGTVKDSINHTHRDYHINQRIINLYRIYWSRATGPNNTLGLSMGNGFGLAPTQTIMEVKDLDSYVERFDSHEYNYVNRQKTSVCMEVTSKDTGQTEQQHAIYMLKQLDNLFGLHGRYEKRKMKCLVLYETDSLKRFKSKDQTRRRFVISNPIPPDISFNQDNIHTLVYYMNQVYGNPPVFDNTSYKGLIDMKFTLNSWKDIPTLRKALNAYGLDFREEERELDTFVLTEVK